MISVPELKQWVATLSDDSFVAVDEGGLTLEELSPTGAPTEKYLEVGGNPENED